MKMLLLLMALFFANRNSFAQTNLGLFSEDEVILNLSNVARAIGIKSFDRLSLHDDEVVYELKAIPKNINGYDIDFNTFKFTYSLIDDQNVRLILQRDDEITTLLINNADKTITYVEQSFVISEEGDIVLNDNEQNKISTLISMYIEVTNPDIVRFIEENIDPANTCTKTAMSIRYTKSSAIEHVNQFVNKLLEAHPECKRLYGVDTGCLWGDYGCTATQEIQCDGGSSLCN